MLFVLYIGDKSKHNRLAPHKHYAFIHYPTSTKPTLHFYVWWRGSVWFVRCLIREQWYSLHYSSIGLWRVSCYHSEFPREPCLIPLCLHLHTTQILHISISELLRVPTMMTELIDKIKDLCVTSQLAYDGSRPISVGPGVWMFYATEMTEACSKHGSCRQTPHYVVQLGDRVAFG